MCKILCKYILYRERCDYMVHFFPRKPIRCFYIRLCNYWTSHVSLVFYRKLLFCHCSWDFCKNPVHSGSDDCSGSSSELSHRSCHFHFHQNKPSVYIQEKHLFRKKNSGMKCFKDQDQTFSIPENPPHSWLPPVLCFVAVSTHASILSCASLLISSLVWPVLLICLFYLGVKLTYVPVMTSLPRKDFFFLSEIFC